MSKKVVLFAIVGASLLLFGCTAQLRTRNFGGAMTINLPPCQKLVNVTWKEANFWTLTRPMKKGEEPDTYTFKEDSAWGVLEGTITIQEHACS